MADSPPDIRQHILPLRGVVQKYAWGHLGSDSEVARLVNAHETIDPASPYAELWLGTHVSAPSQISQYDSSTQSSTFVPLSKHIKDHFEGYGEELPFLLKVLSIRTALSIQAHPDAKLASKLHSLYPNVYKDPNHKPELVIPITEMEAMCGFRPIEEIVGFLHNIPELRNVIDQNATEAFLHAAQKMQKNQKETPYNLNDDLKNALQKLFYSLMTASQELVSTQLNLLVNRLLDTKNINHQINQNDHQINQINQIDQQNNQQINQQINHQINHQIDQKLTEIILRISNDMPGDVGLFCVFLLNVLYLKPGQAIYLAPNEPHAYIQGNCVECMATSDNVVRAGLTPKFKDVETLIPMLTYTCGKPKIMTGSTSIDNPKELIFDPPVDEFQVGYLHLEPGAHYSLPASQGPSIILIQKGHGSIKCPNLKGELALQDGSAYFIHPKTLVYLTATEELNVYRAMLPSKSSRTGVVV